MAWLHSVYFLDRNHGWVAGSKGTLLETNNGGQTWMKVHPPTEDNLRDVYFANDHDGWLVCERDVYKLKSDDEARSYLLKTSDGGISWQRVTVNGTEPNSKMVHAVFTDADHGWAFGEGGVTMFTRDGGASWSRQTLPTQYLIFAGAFVDSQHGWLVGAGATILLTIDGGLTWHKGFVRDGLGARFTAACFIGNRLGWAAGSRGRVFETTDGGRLWFEQRTGVDADLFDIKFIDAGEGWIAGANGTLLHTTNGGVRWTVESGGTTHALERIFLVDRNHRWVVGFGGTILAYNQSGLPRLK